MRSPTHLGFVAPEPTLLCSNVGGVMAKPSWQSRRQPEELAAIFPCNKVGVAQGLRRGFWCAFSFVIRFFSAGMMTESRAAVRD